MEKFLNKELSSVPVIVPKTNSGMGMSLALYHGDETHDDLHCKFEIFRDEDVIIRLDMSEKKLNINIGDESDVVEFMKESIETIMRYTIDYCSDLDTASYNAHGKVPPHVLNATLQLTRIYCTNMIGIVKQIEEKISKK